MFLHVSFGAAWTIIDLFLGLVLGPIMGRMSIPARVEFTTRLMPKMLLIMPTVVTITLAAGWQLGYFLGTVDRLPAARLARGELHRRRRHGDHRARPARAGERRGADRAEEAAAQPAVIERLMKRFIYSAGVIGVMQVATLVIMTKIASG